MSPLVLVHGLLGSLEYFDPQSYFPVTKVLCPELHGYGGLACIDDLSLYDQADFVNQFFEQNHIQEPCWLLGHSVGGAVVNLFAEKYPEKVKGISTSKFPQSPSMVGLVTSITEGSRK